MFAAYVDVEYSFYGELFVVCFGVSESAGDLKGGGSSFCDVLF